MKRRELDKYLAEVDRFNKLAKGPLQLYLKQQKEIDQVLQSGTISTAVDIAVRAVQQFHIQQDSITQAVVEYSKSFDAIIRQASLASLGAIESAMAGMAAIEKINTAIMDADFLAAMLLSDPADGQGDPGPEGQIESQLIEVVSEESFKKLKLIEFAPLKILEKAIRDPRILRKVSPRQFEEFVAYLIEKLGFEDIVLTPESNDGGRDIVATKTFVGIPVVFAFECKRYAEHRTVGVDVARALLGTIGHHDTQANKGVLVTTSRFSSGVSKLFLTEPHLSGKDFDGIIGWIKEAARSR